MHPGRFAYPSGRRAPGRRDPSLPAGPVPPRGHHQLPTRPPEQSHPGPGEQGQPLRGEHHLRRSLGRHPAPVEEHQAVGVLGRQGEVVQGSEHGDGALPAQALHQVEHLLLVADVERGGRLVEEQHRRILGHRPGQHHPLPLPSGQGPERPVGQQGGVQALEGGQGEPAVGCALRRPVAQVGDAPQQHVLRGRHPAGENRVLGYQRHQAGGPPARQGGEGMTPYLDLTLGGDRAGQGPQQRRLAGAVGAHQRHPLPRPHRQVHPGDGHQPVVGDLDPPAADAVHGPHPCRLDRSTIAKKGPPTKAVITPMGSSAGERIERAPRSASIRKAAPPSTESGRITR